MANDMNFSNQIPKGDAFGIRQAVQDAVAEFLETGHSPMIPIVGVVDIKTVKVEEGQTHVPVVRIRRLEALTQTEQVRSGHALIQQAIDVRKGVGTTLPFEESEVIREAFAVDADAERDAQDEREAKEDEDLSEYDRLRRHLVAVHKWDGGDPRLEDMNDLDIRKEHAAEHTDGANPGMPDHDVDDWLWRRVDIEAATSEGDGMPADDNLPMNTEDRIVDASENPPNEATDDDTDRPADEEDDQEHGGTVSPLFRDAKEG